MASSDVTKRRAAFRALHESGCFVIPNPWDRGSARYLRHLGFHALATTSAGFAFTRGVSDATGGLPVETVLAHVADIVDAVDLPVNVDFQSGHSHDPEGVAANVRACVETGAAGLSIEDATGDAGQPLYDLPTAIARLEAARAAIDASGADVLLTARTECFLVGHERPFEESLKRLPAFAEAGADVLFAPGAAEPEQIRAIVRAVAPKPVNVIMSRNTGLSVANLGDLGVRRISVGSSLARAAWTGFMRAADAIAKDGSFRGFDGMVPFAEINGFFERDGLG